MTCNRRSLWRTALASILMLSAGSALAQIVPNEGLGSLPDSSTVRFNHTWYYRCPVRPRVVLKNSNFPNPPYAPFGKSDAAALDDLAASIEAFSWGDPEFTPVGPRFPTTSDPLDQFDMIAARLDDFTFLWDRAASSTDIDKALQRVVSDATALHTILDAQRELVEIARRIPDRERIWSAHFKHRRPMFLPKPCDGPFGDLHGYKEGDDFTDALGWRNPLLSLKNAFTDTPGLVLRYPTTPFLPETTSYGKLFDGTDINRQPQYRSYTSTVTYTEIGDVALQALNLNELDARLANSLATLNGLSATANSFLADSPSARTRRVLARRGVELGRLSIPLAARLNAHIEDHRAEVAQHQVVIDRLTSEVEERAARYVSAQSDIDTATRTYEALDASYRVVQGKLQAVSERIRAYNTDMTTLGLETYDDLPDDERTMGLARRRVRLMDLRAQKQSAKLDIDLLRQESSALTLRMDRIKLDLSLFKTALRDAVTTLREAKSALSGANSDQAAANTVIDRARPALDRVEAFNALPDVNEGR